MFRKGKDVLKKELFILLMMVLAGGTVSFAVEGEVSREQAQSWTGQDLQLSGREVVSWQGEGGEHILVFQDGFSMSIGGNQFSSRCAVVWVQGAATEFLGQSKMEYKVKAYLEDGVSVKKGKSARTTDLEQTVVEGGQSLVVQFDVGGEVFVTADKRDIADLRGSELYKRAEAVEVPTGPKFVVQPEAKVPELPREKIHRERPPKKEITAAAKPKKERAVVSAKGEKEESAVPAESEKEEAGAIPAEAKERAVAAPPKKIEKEHLPARGETVERAVPEAEKQRPVAGKPRRSSLLEMIFGAGEEKAARPAKAAVLPAATEGPRFMYPVNIAPAGAEQPKIERTKAPDGTDIATVIGRFYIWQKQDAEGGLLLELEADRAVIFYSGTESFGQEGEGLAGGGVRAIYMSGDVVMTEGQRTVRADEMYYDFANKRALAVNAVVRNFDVERGIPIYVRADKLRRLAEDKFSAEGATLTSSEFYLPQISLTVSSLIITDTTAIDAQKGRVSNSSIDVQMRDVRFKKGKQTLFYWPGMRANLERPDIPIKGVSIGHDSDFGTFIESRWYLSRMLGLREPEGTESTFLLDYYSERGVGSGVEIDYARENYYGELLGYVINDDGEDRLGRMKSRKDLKPEEDTRGRFTWRHRQFLPYNWQLTTGVGYLSDENFLESFYRREFNTGEKHETYIHLKRLQDNWAVSVLGKGRINRFADELEELPSGEFHLTGQSLFKDRFTLYSDTELGRLRQKIGKDHSEPVVLGATPPIATNLTVLNDDWFSFLTHRTELDMPLRAKSFKIVPYAAGTFSYDDRSGFTRTLVDGSNTGSFGEKDIWIGEAGVRIFPNPVWKDYPNVKSRLWDLNQLRHIVRPYVTAVVYEESDDVVQQRDAVSAGLSQRLLTKRGPADQQKTVEWMRLDTEVTWLNHTGEAEDASPDRFIWARPIVPARVLSSPEIFNGDLITHDGTKATGLHRFENWGPRRDYFSADYIWRMSDTTALLSDLNFDIQSSTIQQYNIGFSHLCWPNLSYYIGSRYLKRVRVLDEVGSNTFVFAINYVLDPRYTVVFAQECDLDYGVNVRSEVTVLRRYHRMYYGLTFSADESLDRQAVVFSIWPQGVPEMGMGGRRYVGMTGPAGY